MGMVTAAGMIMEESAAVGMTMKSMGTAMTMEESAAVGIATRSMDTAMTMESMDTAMAMESMDTAMARGRRAVVGMTLRNIVMEGSVGVDKITAGRMYTHAAVHI